MEHVCIFKTFHYTHVYVIVYRLYYTKTCIINDKKNIASNEIGNWTPTSMKFHGIRVW